MTLQPAILKLSSLMPFRSDSVDAWSHLGFPVTFFAFHSNLWLLLRQFFWLIDVFKGKGATEVSGAAGFAFKSERLNCRIESAH